MRPTFLCLFILSLCTCVSAQKLPGSKVLAKASDTLTSPYFQQELDYEIDATLDDKAHVLHAQLTLRYQNNSPDTLRQIPFHMWPRAFSSDKTAFAKQLLRNGSTRFHFAEPRLRGTLDSLAYTVDGKVAQHAFDEEHPDISRLTLNEPLLPGASITISTPFRVKIPASFSRLGRVGTSYQMTQWFPKPAVYDREGWHAMPYLDQGEFYSEFGNFTVRLTLPDNYLVGATGTLQEASERQWLLRKAAEYRAELSQRVDLSEGYVAEPFPTSSGTMKTISWQAEQVHDFAWFADKRFKVLHDTLDLGAHSTSSVEPRTQDAENRIKKPGTVDVWAFFTETEAALWKDATDYLKRATRFYSDRVGRYPYPQVTGVQSALSAGGGMEYPMITVIGRNGSGADLDEVLAHEVGHNWFYGILASNERDHPWMDEGLNSYYEKRYMATFYPDRKLEFPVVGVVDYNRLGYHYTARQGKDQAPDTRADSLSMMNYWITAYSKPTLAMQGLENAFRDGAKMVDSVMHFYYERWKFRHPQPIDLYKAMEEAVQLNVSQELNIYMESTLTSEWRRTEDGGEAISRNLPWENQGFLYEENPIKNPLDLWGHNNYYGKKELDFSLGTAQEDIFKRQLFYLPLAGYNLNDGIQLGAAFHNRTLEPRKFEWMLAPMFGFGSGTLTGFAGAQYRMPRPFAGAQQLVVGLGTQRFSDFTLGRTEEAYAYQRTALRATLTFDHPPITERESQLTLQVINLARNRPIFSGDTLPSGTQTEGNLFVRAGYTHTLDREINPRSFSVHLEYKNRDNARNEAFEASHLRLEAELTGGYQYERNRFLRWRLFGGYFLSNDLRESSFNPASAFSLVDNATTDYRYDDLYAGRGAPAGSWTEQQTERRQGGFRAPISPAFGFGRSNSYLTALNVDADLPLEKIPLAAFFDAGLYGAKPTGSDPIASEFSWVGGLGLSFLDGQAGIYVPLVADPDTRDLLEQRGNLLDRITLRLNLSSWLPWRKVDGVL